MALEKVCAADHLGAGQMDAFFVDGWEVVVVRDRHGELHALDGMCPHEDTPLVDGDFDGAVLTCLNHFWSFDVSTGRGINPPTCKLAKYFVEVRDDDIYVDRDRAASS
jgi:toluene monooxygenase system ferredoxin subunit